MIELLAIIVATLLGLVANTAATPAPEPGAPIERPQLEQRPAIIIIDPTAELPAGVDPAAQPALIEDDGTIINADGSTDCVTASPCDFARAGYAPGEPHPDDIDPLWAELEGER